MTNGNKSDKSAGDKRKEGTPNSNLNLLVIITITLANLERSNETNISLAIVIHKTS